jgi:hypothetical protein
MQRKYITQYSKSKLKMTKFYVHCPLQLHNSVQGRSNFLQMHLPRHSFLQPQFFNICKAFDASSNVNHLGVHFSFETRQPQSSMFSGSFCNFVKDCAHTYLQQNLSRLATHKLLQVIIDRNNLRVFVPKINKVFGVIFIYN